jgi:ketosteroid isomerase-like protein
MLKRIAICAALVFVLSTVTVFAQNTNSSNVRPRTTSTTAEQNTNRAAPETQSTQAKPAATPKPSPKAAAVKPAPAAATTVTPGSATVVAAFNALLDGIRKADVNAVSNIYWKSSRLTLFNRNGTVTKGWEQMRQNRENSYKNVKDVKLTCRDVAITMLGHDGALATCLYTQSQTFKGEPETATGRMTLVFRRIGKDWRAIHLHTSNDKEDDCIPASEQSSPVVPKQAP